MRFCPLCPASAPPAPPRPPEPDDLTDIVLAFAERAGITDLAITTSGFFLDRMAKTVEIVTERTKANLRVAVSLDGLKEVHNQIRRNEQAFDKAELAIRTLEKMSITNPKIKPIINSVISIDNIESYSEFYRYVRANYKCDFVFTFLRQDARDVFQLDKSLLWDSKIGPNLLPDLKRCRKLMEEIRKIENYSYLINWRLKVREYHLKIVETKKPVVKCIAPKSFATLFPDGGVSLCEVVRPFANVGNFDYDFIRCWTSDAAEQQRKQLSHCYCTYPCALTETMFLDPKPILEVLDE